jgi:hypothetical protein
VLDVDDIDHAQRISEMLLDVSIKNARPKGRALVPKGDCHFCEEKLDVADKLFCDLDCSKDWEKLQRKLKNSPQ